MQDHGSPSTLLAIVCVVRLQYVAPHVVVIPSRRVFVYEKPTQQLSFGIVLFSFVLFLLCFHPSLSCFHPMVVFRFVLLFIAVAFFMGGSHFTS